MVLALRALRLSMVLASYARLRPIAHAGRVQTSPSLRIKGRAE